MATINVHEILIQCLYSHSVFLTVLYICFIFSYNKISDWMTVHPDCCSVAALGSWPPSDTELNKWLSKLMDG